MISRIGLVAGRSVHDHVLVVRQVLDLGLDVWVVVGRRRGNGATRSLVVALDLVAVHEVLTLGGDGRRHVAVGHSAEWLLWSSWEHVGSGVDLL